MKIRSILNILFSFFLLSGAAAQQSGLMKEELENFLVITDRDFYLSGDRVWFAAKLLKNHESYRYSKLAYIAVLDASGKAVHEEKMLLTGQDMAYGDLFIPETSASGVFSIVVYTKWMSNYGDFPIARKQFLVTNPSAPVAAGEPALFWEQVPFENAPISLYHTSDQTEVIEILDSSGRSLEVLEAVAPLQQVLSKVKPSEAYRLVFRNKEYRVEPKVWFWDPADFSLSSAKVPQGAKVVTHSDWMLLEELEAQAGKTLLEKSRYQNLNSFNISVLDQSGSLLWSYQVQLPAKSQGQLQLSSKGQVGEGMKLDLAGFPQQFKNGLVLAGRVEDARVTELAELINHPNWKNLSAPSSEANLPAALAHAVEGPKLLKDYSPMFDYKVWSVSLQDRFASSTRPAGFGFSLPEALVEAEVDRRVYQEHFEIGDEVVALQSPFTPDKSYKLDEYDEFPDLESLIKEIIPQVRLKKASTGGRKEIFVANTDNQNVKFNKRPLVLIDFYRPASMEEVWNIDLTSLDRIELYYHRATVESTNLGEEVGDGLLILYTKNNSYFLKNNVPKQRYFLSDVTVPRIQDYSQRAARPVTANPLQYMDTGLRFDRGKSKSGNLTFDTAGDWLVETWVFGNSEFERMQKRIQVEH